MKKSVPFGLCLVVSLASLFGWILHVPILTSISADWVQMKIWTATMFVVCAVSGLLVHRFTATALGLTMFTALANLLGPPASIFHLFEHITVQDSGVMTSRPGMPSACTFAGFVVFAIAMFTHQTTNSRVRLIPVVFLLIAPIPVLLAYLYSSVTGNPPPPELICYDAGESSAMAVHTALGFLFLGWGMSHVRNTNDPVEQVRSEP